MKRHQMSPAVRLILELRTAALRIGDPAMRRAAARSAETIPVTWGERFDRGAKGKVAKAARALLRHLPDLDACDFEATAQVLRDMADALAAPRGRAVEETRSGRRRSAA